MKKRYFKLTNRKRMIKAKAYRIEMNSLRIEKFLENFLPISCAIGAIKLSVSAFNLEKHSYMKYVLLTLGIALGITCIGSAIKLNTTEESKERNKRIKELKIKRKKINKRLKKY